MARYRDAVFWIVANDDTEFLNDPDGGHLSVTATFAADMFGKTDAQVRADLIQERARQGRAVERESA